jgi:hypothetical protein
MADFLADFLASSSFSALVDLTEISCFSEDAYAA